MILVWTIPFNIFHAFGGNIATSAQKEKKAASIFMSMAVVNVVLNLILIPQLGIIGASFSTVLTDMFATMQFYTVLFRHEFGAGLQKDKLARLAIASLLMGLLVVILHRANVFIIIPIAAIFYLGMVWLTGAFSLQERGQILQAAVKVFPRRLRAVVVPKGSTYAADRLSLSFLPTHT